MLSLTKQCLIYVLNNDEKILGIYSLYMNILQISIPGI